MSTVFYSFKMPILNTDAELDFSAFRGKVVLIANTASKCGFTPQYEGLQHLWTRYRSDGLVVVGVPSNDFGQQEPGDEASIAGNCAANFGVSFPMTGKSRVIGAEATPIFKWLREEGGVLSRPRWNFYKYLVSRDGHLANWFTPLTKPGARRFEEHVRRCLDA